MSENKCNEIRAEVFESRRKNRAKFSELIKTLLVDPSECKQRQHEAPLRRRNLQEKWNNSMEEVPVRCYYLTHLIGQIIVRLKHYFYGNKGVEYRLELKKNA